MCKVVVFPASAVWSQTFLMRSLAHPFSVDKSVWAMTATWKDNDAYEKSPCICVSCHTEQHSVMSIIIFDP